MAEARADYSIIAEKNILGTIDEMMEAIDDTSYYGIDNMK
jgi:hypothetical protein